MPQQPPLSVSVDELAVQLAQLEEQAEAGPTPASADPTVTQLKAELDTFVAVLRQKPQPSPYDNETGCGRVTEMVRAIGLDPTNRGEATFDHRGEPGDPTGAEVVPLGTLASYELISKLGEGGMGAVYKARHIKLDKIVAIKVLPAERLKDKDALARFEREMRAVGKLEHPNIVRAMDAGEAGGTHYLVMEYVQGIDLSQLVKVRGPLPVAEACELIRQAAIGLEEAQNNDMVHRDIKPSNIMLCAVGKRKPPVVKILDMGLALLSEAHSADVQGLTTTGQMMGTLDYMAPEQGGDSKNVDIRADIYALGASLYKLLCGEPIYHGKEYQTPVQKLMALATQPAPPIQQRRPGVSNELAAVLHRMLEKYPEQRFATPNQVAEALAPFCAGANLAALLGSVGFDVAPAKDATASATQSSMSRPDADTGVSEFLAHPRVESPRTKPRTKAEAGRKRPSWSPLAIGGGLAGGIVALAAAIIFFFQTPHGTLRVEINDPSVEVTVKGSDIVLRKAENEEVTLATGGHTLVVKRGDFSFETSSLTLKKGKTTTVQVNLLPGELKVIDGNRVIGQRDLLPAAIAETKPTPAPVKVGGIDYSDPAAVAGWLLANKKIAHIGFEVDGQLQNLNVLPTGPFKVRSLDFHPANNGGNLKEEDIPRLAVLTDLEELTLGRQPLTDAGLASLAPLKKLKRLGVGVTMLTPAAMTTIRSFPELEFLQGPDYSDTWLKLLAGMPSLRGMFFYRETLSDEGVSTFKEFPNLTELKFIECGEWSNEKLTHLKYCKNLSKLTLSYTPITDDSIDILKGLNPLTELNVEATKLTEAGVKKLAAALPQCKITWDGGVIEPTDSSPDRADTN